MLMSIITATVNGWESRWIMVNFFRSITDFLTSIWTMISNFCVSMFNALVLIAEVPSSAFRLIPFVPAVIGSSIAIVIAVASVKLVLGWGNQ